MTRTQELRQLMRQHRLNSRDVARILKRSHATVRTWRCEGPSAERQTIPEHMLELLKVRLRDRTPFDDLPTGVRREALSAQGGEVIG